MTPISLETILNALQSSEKRSRKKALYDEQQDAYTTGYNQALKDAQGKISK